MYDALLNSSLLQAQVQFGELFTKQEYYCTYMFPNATSHSSSVIDNSGDHHRLPVITFD